jgi:hypothetical protein
VLAAPQVYNAAVPQYAPQYTARQRITSPSTSRLAPPSLFLLLLSSTTKLLTTRILAGMVTMAAVAAVERLTGVSREWIHRVDNASARLVLLQSIRTAVIQAGARLQWGDYDRFPAM